MGLLIASNAVVLIILVQQKIAGDRLQLAMMKLCGASKHTILAWYALPLTTLAGIASALGMVVAQLFVEFRILPVLAQSNSAMELPWVTFWLLFLAVVALVHGVLTERQSRSLTESALN